MYKRQAVKHPELWDQTRDEDDREKLKYHDQGILQDLLVDDTVDGRRWSNFQVRRTGTVAELLDQTYGYDHTICHYGGTQKPFFDWAPILNWPPPF